MLTKKNSTTHAKFLAWTQSCLNLKYIEKQFWTKKRSGVIFVGKGWLFISRYFGRAESKFLVISLESFEIFRIFLESLESFQNLWNQWNPIRFFPNLWNPIRIVGIFGILSESVKSFQNFWNLTTISDFPQVFRVLLESLESYQNLWNLYITFGIFGIFCES